MLRRALIAAMPAALLAGAANAAEEKKPKEEIGQYVDISPVALPVVVRGQLVNYVFVSVRVVLTRQANAGKWRAREPFFRDALVRAAHRTPFTRADNYAAIDVEKLKAAMMRESIAIAGARDIAAISVGNQTPKRTTGLPKPAVAAPAKPKT